MFIYTHTHIYIYISLVGWVFANGWETRFQSQVKIYHRFKKWYLIPPCLKYISKVKWSNPRKGIMLSPTPLSNSSWKENLQVALDYNCQLYFIYIFWCSNTVVFSVRIFHNSVVGHEWFYKCCAMELVSDVVPRESVVFACYFDVLILLRFWWLQVLVALHLIQVP